MQVALLDKPNGVGVFSDLNTSPLLVVQSSDFPKVLHIYQKLCRVKKFLDEIAEEFIDAKSVRMLKVP